MRFDDEPVNFEELTRLQNLDAQIDQRLHGSARALPNQLEALDPELLRDLRAFYESRDQAFQHALDRVWGHLEQHGVAPASQSQARDGPAPRPGVRQERIYPLQQVLRTGQRWSARVASLVAAVLLAVLIGGLALGLVLVHPNSTSPPGSTPQNPGRGATATPFTVTSVDLAVTPTSIAGTACGTQITLTYTATFHIAAGGPGGTIQFEYTMNNGRSSTSASIPVAAGQTSATYRFTWSGQLPSDHTSPESGGVIVTSPNQVNSPLVAPIGSCS